MKNVTIQDILEVTGGRLLSGSSLLKLTHLSTDSRVIMEDTLFVPIVGANMDGHDFINKAIENGAKAVLTKSESYYLDAKEKGLTEDLAFVLVNDTTDAIQKIGKMARMKLSIPAIGVTGSVGKTTTREMIALALSSEKKVYKTDKNYNNWLGVPLTLSEMTDEDDIAVLELGLNVRGELGLISSLTNIETAVITNIGVAHIEFYGTQDEICKEKFTITNGFFKENPNEKLLVLNANDPYLMKYKDYTGYPYVTYGSVDSADYQAKNIRIDGVYYVFDLYIRKEYIFTVKLGVLGEHNVLNTVAAFAVCDRYGIDLNHAKEALEKFTGFKKRLQLFEKDGFTVIDDTYNASPQSMKAGLDVLSNFTVKSGCKKYAVLGDMFELGPDAPKYHYEVGEYAATKPFDAYILIGECAQEIKRALNEHAPFINTYSYKEKADVVSALKSVLKEGDIVYIKASNGMKLHDITVALTGIE